ncbi:uncharacterized protein LOC126855604 [Cataglyphis hispanica]|uniref:uncharacterized protein LOC126855604 n=1 Tax=Cataglyphis hispanica TaxID=1086592 RepID=UPI00217F355D|nr:uncharacterized protein LOC126855604 [Cataglyphis hispanica]
MEGVNQKRSSRVLKRARNRRNRRLRKRLARAQAEPPEINTSSNINVNININISTVDTPHSPTPATSPPLPSTSLRSESPTPFIILLSDSPYSFPHRPSYQKDPLEELRDTNNEGESPLSSASRFNPEEVSSETSEDMSRSEPEPQPHRQRLSEDQFRLWILGQFPSIYDPLPDGIIRIGPGSVDLTELRTALTEGLPDSVIPWFVPGCRHPIAVPIKVLWKQFPPSTCILEEIS